MNAPAKPIAVEATAAEAALAAEVADMLAADPTPARRAAATAFQRAGLPTRRRESWHYTDLRAALRAVAPLAATPDAAALVRAKETLAAIGPAAGPRIVLVDGVYAPALSTLGPDVAVSARAAAEAPADAVASLAAALARGRLELDLRSGAVEVVHVATGATTHSAALALSVAAGVRGSVVERFVGAGAGAQRHALCEIAVAEGGALDHVVWIGDEPGLHLETQTMRLAKGARYGGFALVPGGGLVRRQIFAALEGEEAKIALGGLSLIDGARKADTTLEVVHAAPNGESREFYKHVVADEGVGVYQGKVIVNPGAQKTDGGMKSQAVLLSPAAQMNNKPELEIFADDVVCGHGATVAALDPEQIFYLQARALPRAEAQAMVLEAFGAEAIERGVADETMRETLLAAMRDWLARRGRAAP